MIAPAGSLMFAPTESDRNRFYNTPPFFIFAFESQITMEKIAHEAFKFRLEEYSPGFSADGIFILNKGFVIDLGDGLGSFKIYDEQRVSSAGWQGVHSQHVLFDFLAWLSSVMPRMLGGGNILTPYLIEFNKNRI